MTLPLRRRVTLGESTTDIKSKPVELPESQGKPLGKNRFRRACWAARLGGCDSISKEHILSSSVAKTLGEDIVGFSLQDGRRIRSQDAKPKILCRHHNSRLSQFDSEAARLFSLVCNYFRGPAARFLVSGGAPAERRFDISGWKLERWMLKTFLNQAVWNGSTPRTEEVWHAWGVHLVDYLFDAKPFPGHWGMYVFPSGRQHALASSLQFHPIFKMSVRQTKSRMYRKRHGGWTEEFQTPLWHYLCLFGVEIAFVGNITFVPETDWVRILTGMTDEPQKHATYRPSGLWYLRPPPKEAPSEQVSRLVFTLDWQAPTPNRRSEPAVANITQQAAVSKVGED